MATATMATAAGAAALLYYTLNRRLHAEESRAEEDREGSGEVSKSLLPSSRSRAAQRPARAPATWLETISTLSETLRFTYSETLGKWPIGDLAFGISFLLKRQESTDNARSVPCPCRSVLGMYRTLCGLYKIHWGTRYRGRYVSLS